MKPNNLIVAFRTHLWNKDIERLARRLYSYCVGIDFVILVDETRGELNTGPFEKLSHKSDFSIFDLPNFPQNVVLWYNADYPLYILRKAYPNYSHYAMVEYDVAVNVDFAEIMKYAAANNVDLIAHNMWRATSEWDWYYTVEAHFSDPWRSFIAVLILSSRAIDHMLLRRQELARSKSLETYSDWPFCEGFIATVIAEMPNPKMEELHRHASLPHYSHMNSFHLDDPYTMLPNSIAHPVLSGPVFVNKRLEIDPIETIFDERSWLRRHLSFSDPSDFIQPVYNRILNLKSANDELKFLSIARQLGWPVKLLNKNIALDKPARSSSTCQFSRNPDPTIDARGGNNGVIEGGYGFYTDFEMDPWWQVDLGADYEISKIVLNNYMDRKDLTLHVAISGSLDNEDWKLRATKIDKLSFGGVDGQPYQFHFEPTFRARYVRVSLIGEGHLHLDEVQVFGREPAA